jgi:hypothetical protein
MVGDLIFLNTPQRFLDFISGIDADPFVVVKLILLKSI